MEKIKSFTIDHDIHKVGFYLSNVMGNIYTYDLRFKTPNGGDYLQCDVMHTIEHVFATVIRNSTQKRNVVYFGPMGCRTGFYLLLLDTEYDVAKQLVTDCIRQCLELSEVPGNTRKECGNYLEHDLQGAKLALAEYLQTLVE